MFGLIKRSFTAIGGLFASNPSDVIGVAKGIGGWIDGQQFTEQEQSQANLKLLDNKLKWIAATQGMNLARRYLAILFALNFLISFQVCLIATVFGFLLDLDVAVLVDSVVKIVGVFQIGWGW